MTYITSRGYRKTHVGRDHPMADSNGECYEHRLVAAEKVGRPLFPHEDVHHLDHDKLNNDPANLEVCASRAEHIARYHAATPTDSELRELILVGGHRFRSLRALGITNTHRVQEMFHTLRAEGHDLSPRHCPNGHAYTEAAPRVRHGQARCPECKREALVRSAARKRQARAQVAA